jgi:hypothetical protein
LPEEEILAVRDFKDIGPALAADARAAISEGGMPSHHENCGVSGEQLSKGRTQGPRSALLGYRPLVPLHIVSERFVDGFRVGEQFAKIGIYENEVCAFLSIPFGVLAPLSGLY